MPTLHNIKYINPNRQLEQLYSQIYSDHLMWPTHVYFSVQVLMRTYSSRLLSCVETLTMPVVQFSCTYLKDEQGVFKSVVGGGGTEDN